MESRLRCRDYATKMDFSKLKWKGRQGLLLISLAIVAVRIFAGLIAALVADSFIAKGHWSTAAPFSLVSAFNRWDAIRYIEIAKHGYSTLELHAFYPAFPLLIRWVSPILHYYGGALALTWVAAVFAVWGVIDVAGRFASKESAWIVGVLLAWNPVSIFFMAGYPEALLVATMIWSLRFCLDKQWWRAAVLAAVASCTLPQGMVSAVVLFLAVLLADRGWRGFVRGVLYGAIGELGLLSYMMYCWVTTGNPFLIQRAESSSWQNHLTYPFHTLLRQLAILVGGHESVQFQAVYVLDACAGVLGGVIAVVAMYLCWRDRRLVLPAVLLALGVLVSEMSVDNVADATARFVFFLAPLYVIVAVCIDKLPRVARLPVAVNLLLVSGMLAVLYGAMFYLGWWLT